MINRKQVLKKRKIFLCLSKSYKKIPYVSVCKATNTNVVTYCWIKLWLWLWLIRTVSRKKKSTTKLDNRKQRLAILDCSGDSLNEFCLCQYCIQSSTDCDWGLTAPYLQHQLHSCHYHTLHKLKTNCGAYIRESPTCLSFSCIHHLWYVCQTGPSTIKLVTS